jgi:hypothetical protein
MVNFLPFLIPQKFRKFRKFTSRPGSSRCAMAPAAPYYLLRLLGTLPLQVPAVDPSRLAGGANIKIAIGLRSSQRH